MDESAVKLVRKSASMAMVVVESEKVATRSGCKAGTWNHIRKGSSAVWLCSGILFCTVVLFVLVSLDPSRVVSEDPKLLVTFPYRIRDRGRAVVEVEAGDRRRLGEEEDQEEEEEVGFPALEGLGMLFRKGKRAMPELVVAHLSETTTVEDLRFFLRGLHRSGMPAQADVVLLFPWRPLPQEYISVIRHEEQNFRRLLAKFRKGAAGESSFGKLSVFNPGAYGRTMSVLDYGQRQESIWGKKQHSGRSNSSTNGDGDDNADEAVHYGAIVGFDMQELDPDDALSGFLDSPSATLRRWVCYQILIGMVRHRYRHVFLTEVTGVFILKDFLTPFKKKDNSLHLYSTGQQWNDSASPESPNSPEPPTSAARVGSIMETVYGDKFWSSMEVEDKSRKVITTSVIIGGVRKVRILAMAMVTEIVRVALLRHPDRAPFRVDAPILSFLVHKSSALGKKVGCHLQVHDSGASIVNLLPGPPRTSAFDDFFFSRRSDLTRFSVIQGLHNEALPDVRRNKILDSLRKDICSSQNDIRIYPDCYSQPLDQQLDSLQLIGNN